MSDYKPEVPSRVRDWVYWIGFIVGGLGLLATGLAPIWLPDLSTQVTATVAVIGGAASWVASGLGVVYRPGVQDKTPESTGEFYEPVDSIPE